MSFKQNSTQNVGLSLRPTHYNYILEHLPYLPYLEILTENYLANAGPPLKKLDNLRMNYPFMLHGVGLSLGSVDPINYTYLKQLKTLINRYQPTWISDHACWTSYQGEYCHELLPLPFTEEVITHLTDRINCIQDFLQRPLLIENISSYISFTHSEMTEWEFLNQIASLTDCKILLDVNNVYVNAINHKFSAADYINSLSPKHVKQIHLAGHEKIDDLLIDTHGTKVCDPVWQLYRTAIKRFGAICTIIEWDNNIPDFPTIFKEIQRADSIQKEVYAVS